jgi:undecaprenyl-diphosphatase
MKLKALVVATVLSAIGFVVLANFVTPGGRVAAMDLAVTSALTGDASPAGRRVAEAVTSLGNAKAFAAQAAIVGIILIARRHYVAAAWWIIAQVGSGFLVLTLKAVFARSRPEFAYVNEVARGWSFPSGHALRTAVLVGFAAYILLRLTHRSRRATAIIVAGALAWALLMAFTRVYLGAHFASDVVASLLAGAAWVGVCALGLEIGLRRENRAG